MGCNCKNKKISENNLDINDVSFSQIKNKSITITAINYVLRFLMFVITSVISIPVVIVFTIYMLFKTILIGKSIDISGTMKSIGTMLKQKENNDENEDEIDEDDEDDYEIYDVDDITVEKKNN